MCEGGFSLIKPTTGHWNTVITVMSVLIVAETITFLLATLVHLGIPVPLGFTQPQIIPAAIAEGLCGIFLAVSAYAIFTYKTWAWRVALAAHIFAVAGGLLGIFAAIRSSAGGGPDFIPPPPPDTPSPLWKGGSRGPLFNVCDGAPACLPARQPGRAT